MWQCCETNLQQHSKWITEAEAWCLGKDRLLVCVSMCSCVYSMWERLMLHSRVQYSFVCTCSRRIFLLCNVSTTAIWIAVHIDLISSGCILKSPSSPQRVTPLNSFGAFTKAQNLGCLCQQKNNNNCINTNLFISVLLLTKTILICFAKK